MHGPTEVVGTGVERERVEAVPCWVKLGALVALVSALVVLVLR